MLIKIHFILHLILPIVHQKNLDLEFGTTDTSYTYLSANQTMFHFNLSRQISFDRKQFRDIWIYKNGFVTMGVPLEEKHYPILDNEEIEQPFENMVGSNIIAVFITANEIRPNSVVSARQLFEESMDHTNRKLLRNLESKVKRVYGKSLINHLEHVVEIEWTHIAPIGADKDGENSFRLLLLSNGIQTFGLFQYKNIKSTCYKNLDKCRSYQSGLNTYSDTKYILPPYDVVDSSLPLFRTSNIGIKNARLIMMGDTSYNMDIGWLDGYNNSKTNLMRSNTEIYWKRSLRKENNPKVRKNRFIAKQKQGSTNFNFPITLNPPSIMRTGERLKKTVISEPQRKLQTIKLANSPPFRITYNIYSKSSYENIATGNKVTTTEKNLFMTAEYKNTISEDTVIIKSIPYLKNIKPTNINKIILQSYENMNKFHKNKFPPKILGEEPLYTDNSRKVHKNIKMTTFTSVRMTNQNKFNNPRMQHLRSKECSNKICNQNEECFISKDNVCCKCSVGTIYLDKRCIKNNINFFINSRGLVHIPSMGKQLNLEFSLVIAKRSSSNEDFQRAHLTLISETLLSEEMRNFLMILYPLFHVPMSFYAFSWYNETVPNLSALVDQVAGINIHIDVGNYEDIYISFKLNRSNGKDKWTITINGLDMKKLNGLNLKNRKLDESSPGSHNLIYNLLHSNSIEYPEQTVIFNDEDSHISLKIKWRGTMTFSATCLSKHIANKRFYVKFSEKSYCHSDCLQNSVGNKGNCRVMCLSSPHVFDTMPSPCHGNFCGANMICVNKENYYECRCKEGFNNIGDKCVNNFPSTSSLLVTSNNNNSNNSNNNNNCQYCSVNADCIFVHNVDCCICKSGYIGSGRTCVVKDSNFEINNLGTMKIIPYIFQVILERKMNFYYRKTKSDHGLQYASFVEIENIPYTNVKEQQVLHSILLLSPLYDVLLAIFADNHSLQTNVENIFTISRGSIDLRIVIQSTFFLPIEILINVNELHAHLNTAVSIIGIQARNPNDNILLEAKRHFNTRGIADIIYSVKGRKIIFPKREINLPKTGNGQKMWWEGTGKLSSCVRDLANQNYLVKTGNQYRCNASCNHQSCSPYCQSSPVIKILTEKKICLQQCHPEARCLKGRCICSPGFAGNGTICNRIIKILECSNSNDCVQKPFTICRNGQCVCKFQIELYSTNCTNIQTCRTCEDNEECINWKCVCKAQYVRNRISKRCVFDCSFCDNYSTRCFSSGCMCKLGFLPNNPKNSSCYLPCIFDNDCPTYEICTPFKICMCPQGKENGICLQKPICDKCHRNGICQENVCKCKENFIGNGVNCTYNCSLCFNDNFCDSHNGCICPSSLKRNENNCTYKHCYGQCPIGSECQKVQDTYKCVCLLGSVMIGKECLFDVVRLNILPYGKSIYVNEGENLELICLGSSKFSRLMLNWYRKSEKSIIGFQEYTDLTNTSLRLRIKSLKLDDEDQYICREISGKQTEITVSIYKGMFSFR